MLTVRRQRVVEEPTGRVREKAPKSHNGTRSLVLDPATLTVLTGAGQRGRRRALVSGTCSPVGRASRCGRTTSRTGSTSSRSPQGSARSARTRSAPGRLESAGSRVRHCRGGRASRSRSGDVDALLLPGQRQPPPAECRRPCGAHRAGLHPGRRDAERSMNDNASSGQ